MQIDWVFVGFAFAAGLLSPFFLWVIKSLGYASKRAFKDTIHTARNLREDAKNWRLITGCLRYFRRILPSRFLNTRTDGEGNANRLD